MRQLTGCGGYTLQKLYVREKTWKCDGELFGRTIITLQFTTLEFLSDAIRKYLEIGELKFEIHTLEKPCLDFNSSTWFSELKHFVLCVFYMKFFVSNYETTICIYFCLFKKKLNFIFF